jgi:hypothetical protein
LSAGAAATTLTTLHFQGSAPCKDLVSTWHIHLQHHIHVSCDLTQEDAEQKVHGRHVTRHGATVTWLDKQSDWQCNPSYALVISTVLKDFEAL